MAFGNLHAEAAAMDLWAKLFRIARRQYGVVTWAQAVALGIDATTFNRRARREQWPRLHRGVYLVPGMQPNARSLISAALLAAGPTAVSTADTALYLHGVIDTAPSTVTLVVPHKVRASRLDGVEVVRSRTLVAGDRVLVGRLACVVPPRAFLDAAVAHDLSDLRLMLIDARQRRVVEPAAVISRISSLPWQAPGRGRLLHAAVDVDAVGADSVLTDRVHRRLVTAGLRPDPHPVPVQTRGGRRLHPDITFAARRTCIECDSVAHHSTQRAIDLDHRKTEAYAAARWTCIRIGWHRFDRDWDGFVRAVRNAVCL